jgi:hypothetical protein
MCALPTICTMPPNRPQQAQPPVAVGAAHLSACHRGSRPSARCLRSQRTHSPSAGASNTRRGTCALPWRARHAASCRYIGSNGRPDGRGGRQMGALSHGAHCRSGPAAAAGAATPPPPAVAAPASARTVGGCKACLSSSSISASPRPPPERRAACAGGGGGGPAAAQRAAAPPRGEAWRQGPGVGQKGARNALFELTRGGRALFANGRIDASGGGMTLVYNQRHPSNERAGAQGASVAGDHGGGGDGSFACVRVQRRATDAPPPAKWYSLMLQAETSVHATW